MKKSKALAAAMASIAVSGMIAGCAYKPSVNVEPCVYGPAPANLEKTEAMSDAEQLQSASDAVLSDGETADE